MNVIWHEEKYAQEQRGEETQEANSALTAIREKVRNVDNEFRDGLRASTYI